MGKPKYNVRVPKYQAERDRKIRIVRKAQGKAQQHKLERVKGVSGAARSKKKQKRLEHRARMLAASPVGEAMAVEGAGGAGGRKGVAVGRKQKKLKLAPRGSKAKGGGASKPDAAAAAAGGGGGGGDAMQE